MIAAVAAVLASAQVTAATETVRQTGAAAPPPPRRRRRRGEPAVPDGHDLTRPFGRRAGQGRPVLHPDPPSPGGRLPCHRGVPAEANEHPAAELLHDPRGGPVGRPSLNGRAKIKLDPGRYGQPLPRDVNPHRPPPGNDPDAHAACVMTPSALSLFWPGQLSEVPVIAERSKRSADGRVHVPVSQLRHPEGN